MALFLLWRAMWALSSSACQGFVFMESSRFRGTSVSARRVGEGPPHLEQVGLALREMMSKQEDEGRHRVRAALNEMVASTMVLRNATSRITRQIPVSRLGNNALRDIPAASAALATIALCSPNLPSPWDPLIASSYVESIFQLARLAQYALLRLDVRYSEPPAPPGNETYPELWRKILAATPDLAEFVEGWFVHPARGDEPERRARLDELSSSNIEELVSRNFFAKVADDLEDEEREAVVEMRRDLEAALGREFPCDDAAAVPISPQVDPIPTRQHPLLMYASVEFYRRVHRGRLAKAGFERRASEHLAFWIRRGSGAPIVFAHGIGVGLAPYRRFIDRLVAREPTRPVVLVELPSISTSLSAKPLAQGATLAAEVRDALEAEGFAECAFVAHSFGSTLAAFVAKYEPRLLASLVLVEPVCFLLNLAQSTRRVLYDRDTDPLVRVLATDPLNAVSLRRRFWWHEAILLAENLQSLTAPSTVFLSDNDLIVPSNRVREYLAPYCDDHQPRLDDDLAVREDRPPRRSRRRRFADAVRHRFYSRDDDDDDDDDQQPLPDDDAAAGVLQLRLPLTLERFENAGHGRWQYDRATIDRVVTAVLRAADGVDAPPTTALPMSTWAVGIA
ncbi:hypothetical protein CTAYLR_005215 [Chrysophaeum taylorii]|uniref:AB hydrolase-1 domain-containing protein n=1 Tax=Chrysophaeum taylorii TaxID=2483200 RepID=A0AAD7UD66_9STRA|nr:hypothetical protein CTAYLR_005215 [Chrysophaeum taylorii]